MMLGMTVYLLSELWAQGTIEGPESTYPEAVAFKSTRPQGAAILHTANEAIGNLVSL
jgi:hypothetical protein